MHVFSGQLVLWTAQSHFNVLAAVNLIHLLKASLLKITLWMPWLFDVVSNIINSIGLPIALV